MEKYEAFYSVVKELLADEKATTKAAEEQLSEIRAYLKIVEKLEK